MFRLYNVAFETIAQYILSILYILLVILIDMILRIIIVHKLSVSQYAGGVKAGFL